jgi:signal transduction histidine kinase
MGERQQISGLRKSGEEFPAEAAIQRIDLDGHDVYAAVLRDISARQRVEDALHQAIQARDDMMGIVSHDLRNPANAVKMLVRSILEGDTERRLTGDVVERLQVVRQAAEQIDALIQDLLDVSRLEAGRLTVSPERVEVDWLLSRSVEAMRPLAEASGVSLRPEVPADLPSLRADPDRALQVLSNVIGNAIKFTPAGGSVRIGAGLSDGSMLFTVSDTGIGVPPELLPHVFDRFFQVSAAPGRGPRHGAGLGLPIARGIVEAHGGRIWMDSDPATGTTVRFTLPVR